MNDKKDTAIIKIVEDFESCSNLVLHQLDLLNQLFNSLENGISYDITKLLRKNEKKIDNYEIKLDNKIVKAIVLYKPVASDLRQLFAIYRMVINLERIGDQVVKISDLLRKNIESELFIQSASMIRSMFKTSMKMVNTSLISFTNKDKESALWIIKKDDMMNEDNNKIVTESIYNSKLLQESEAYLSSLLDIRIMISSIERIGEQASNIAEATIYALLGKDLRHSDLDDKEL